MQPTTEADIRLQDDGRIGPCDGREFVQDLSRLATSTTGNNREYSGRTGLGEILAGEGLRRKVTFGQGVAKNGVRESLPLRFHS